MLDDPFLLQERLRSGEFPSIRESQHECLVEASTYSRTENAGAPVCHGMQAIDEPDLLRNAIRAGVWQFKIARSNHSSGHPLESETTKRLIRLFADEHRRVSVGVPVDCTSSEGMAIFRA